MDYFLREEQLRISVTRFEFRVQLIHYVFGEQAGNLQARHVEIRKCLVDVLLYLRE